MSQLFISRTLDIVTIDQLDLCVTFYKRERDQHWIEIKYSKYFQKEKKEKKERKIYRAIARIDVTENWKGVNGGCDP